MDLINNILVVMEPNSDHQPALLQAIKIAKKSSASLELFVVVYNRDFISHFNFNQEQLLELRKEYIATKLRWLETYLPLTEVEGLTAKVDIIWDPDFPSAVVTKAARSDISLVIKATKEFSSIRKIFFTPSDWKLLENCSAPLLLTKNNNETEYHHVMAAIDPKPENDKPKMLDEKIIKTAVSMATLFSGNTHVCHCYEPIGIELWKKITSVAKSKEGDNTDFNDYSDSEEKHHKALFNEFLSDYLIKDESTHLVAGSAEVVLPELVKSNQIDLLVMGMGNNGKYLGNLAEKILDNVDCDILSLKCLAKNTD